MIRGDAASLHCDAKDSESIQIAWFKGETPVYLDDSLWISTDGRVRPPNTAGTLGVRRWHVQELRIMSSELEDGGRYACAATNAAGTTRNEILLHVLVPPAIDKSNIIGNPLAVLNGFCPLPSLLLP